MRKKSCILVITALCISLSSCITSKSERLQDFEEAFLFGMVYDYDNQPCPGALIIVDGEEGPATDINGRFAIVSLIKGEHRIRIKKDGYEELSVTFEFISKDQVLYLKITSYNHLLRQIEHSLERKKLKDAEELIRRAEAVTPDDPVGMYLKAIYFIEIDRLEESIRILETILEKGYLEPAVYLTLADIYQYDMRDEEAALRYLEEYLRRQGDMEVEKRVEALK